MHEAALDSWTKRIVSAAVHEVYGGRGELQQDVSLVGELSQLVRDVVLRELRAGKQPLGGCPDVAGELAMAIYLTLAASKATGNLRPHLLLSLHRSLAEACAELAASTGSRG